MLHFQWEKHFVSWLIINKQWKKWAQLLKFSLLPFFSAKMQKFKRSLHLQIKKHFIDTSITTLKYKTSHKPIGQIYTFKDAWEPKHNLSVGPLELCFLFLSCVSVYVFTSLCWTWASSDEGKTCCCHLTLPPEDNKSPIKQSLSSHLKQFLIHTHRWQHHSRCSSVFRSHRGIKWGLGIELPLWLMRNPL